MICSSRPVPSVVTTMARVSPRVEQGRAVGAGQHADADVDRTNGARVAMSIRLAIEDAAAHHLGFDVKEGCS